MSSVIGAVGGVILGGIVMQYYNEKHRERHEQFKKKLNEIQERSMKKREKCKFIMKFIDEIPELSYYEAKQLENKLGTIYLEWNDE